MLPVSNLRVVPNHWGYLPPNPPIIDKYRETDKPDDGKPYLPTAENGGTCVYHNGEPYQMLHDGKLYPITLEDQEKLSTKDLLNAMSPEQRKVAGEIMHLTLSLLAEKRYYKGAARCTLFASGNRSPADGTPAREILQKDSRMVIWNVFLLKIAALLNESYDLYDRAIEVCPPENQNPLPLSRLKPFFEEFSDHYVKIKQKYGPQEGPLPCGIARLEDRLYQRLKQDSISIPEEWKDIPCPYTKRESSDFLKQPLTYEQAAGYFSYLIKIGLSRKELVNEFREFAKANQGVVFERLLKEIEPTSDLSRITLEIYDISDCQALETGNSLGICCAPDWGNKPINLSITEKSFPSKRHIPIANKEWKFVILDEKGGIVRWEAGANRSGKKGECGLIEEIYLSRVKFD